MLLTLFSYNWQVRRDWFQWCLKLNPDEWLRQRNGGMGNFIKTFAHVIDVEYSWIRAIQGKPDVEIDLDDFHTVEEIQDLSSRYHPEVREFLETWSPAMEHDLIEAPWMKGSYEKGMILRHLIAHEIHHIGQLSIWSREMGIKPISASLIDRHL
ncbi:DinB family protein [Peribacillus sp. NPDC097295]|uniref:DinB family protein n=1 Tax=Peribacillus sp. NPDC097295 TaxID=3364402 RepID=UPI00381E449C